MPRARVRRSVHEGRTAGDPLGALTAHPGGQRVGAAWSGATQAPDRAGQSAGVTRDDVGRRFVSDPEQRQRQLGKRFARDLGLMPKVIFPKGTAEA